MHTPADTAHEPLLLAARVPDVRRVPLGRQGDPARAVVLRRLLRAGVVEVPASGFQSSI